MDILKRLLSPEYLIVSEPGPVGGLWPLYAGLGLFFAAGLALAVRLLAGARGRAAGEPGAGGRGWAWLEVWVCLAGLGTVVGRLLNWPGWSARIWLYSFALLAAAGWLAFRARRRGLPEWAAEVLSLLALTGKAARPEERKAGRTQDRKSGPSQSSNLPSFHPSLFLGLALHLAGIALVVAARYHRPVWAAPPVLAALLLPQAPLIARRRAPRLAALAPLLAAYAVTLLWLLYRALGITIIGWQGQAFPNPLVSLFYVDGVVLAAVAYSLLCQLYVTLAAAGRPERLGRWAAAGLLAVTLTWAGIVYLGKRTHGVTATDPYAYAQMGVDLAERGTFLHRFPLFQQVIPLNIPWAPVQPVGYHVPRNDLGDSPSVWATGASVLLAAGYRLGGEPGLYLATPVVGLLLLAATWALVQEILRGRPRSVRYATGAVAVALLATSPENVDRLLVPMADAPAALFTVLTLFFLLRVMRRLTSRPTGKDLVRMATAAALGGVCFGWAYWVRHTQIVLAVPAVAAVAAGLLGARDGKPAGEDAPAGRRPWAAAAVALIAFFGAALLAAVPDILYRWQVFGGPLRTETTELPLMAARHIGPVAWQMLREALVAGEWGYLFPFALYGAYRLARGRGRAALVLGLALAAVLLVHLTYRSLRLRDLISLFPLVDIAVAIGVTGLVERARAALRRGGRRLGPALAAAGALVWVVAALAMARWAMIDNLWRPGWASFGYVRAEQRAGFDRLAELTPANAVIGASLNSGAVMMYAGRDAVRPYDSWTGEDWQVFLDAMQERGRPVYLLDDGALMAGFIAREVTARTLTPVEALPVPLFDAPDRQTGRLYRLEWNR